MSDDIIDPYSPDTYMELRARVWATRDGCSKHYPRYCPPDCPNAGKHDAVLPGGLCACHQCTHDPSGMDEYHPDSSWNPGGNP